jgi:hypothetical protein
VHAIDTSGTPTRSVHKPEPNHLGVQPQYSVNCEVSERFTSRPSLNLMGETADPYGGARSWVPRKSHRLLHRHARTGSASPTTGQVTVGVVAAETQQATTELARMSTDLSALVSTFRV